MRKQFGFSGQTVSISLYTKGPELYTFEARNGRKLEMVKVATKGLVSKLLNNGYHGSELHFEGVDTKTRKFFRQCAGIK